MRVESGEPAEISGCNPQMPGNFMKAGTVPSLQLTWVQPGTPCETTRVSGERGEEIHQSRMQHVPLSTSCFYDLEPVIEPA